MTYASAASLKNCTDDEVVAKVCAHSISQTAPSCKDDAYDRLDDTGYAKKTSDLIDLNDIGKTSASDLLKIDQAAQERFLAALLQVVNAYKSVILALPPVARSFYLERFSELGIPSLSELNDPARVSLKSLGFAHYENDADKIFIDPFFINYKGLSQIEIQMVIAHEMGHFFANKQQFKNKRAAKVHQLIKASEADYDSGPAQALSAKPTSFNESCFVESEKGVDPDFFDEDLADWMASNVASKLINSTQNAYERKARTLNFAYFHCEPEFSGPIGRYIFNYKHKASGDNHQSSKVRISALLRDPELLKNIGCGEKIIRASDRTVLKNCKMGNLGN